MRTIDLGTVGDAGALTFTLVYEATLPSGETVRIVRGLSASGVNIIGRKIMCLSDDDDRIANASVVDQDGEDVTFDFECFRDDPKPGTVEQQRIAFKLLTIGTSD